MGQTARFEATCSVARVDKNDDDDDDEKTEDVCDSQNGIYAPNILDLLPNVEFDCVGPSHECYIPRIGTPVTWCSEKNQSRRFDVGYATTQGRRHTMEDTSVMIGNFRGRDEDLYAIFDGHGGERASTIASTNFAQNFEAALAQMEVPRKTGISSTFVDDRDLPPLPRMKATFNIVFEQIQTMILVKDGTRGEGAGTTALVAYIDSNNTIYVANLGDSRAIVIYKAAGQPPQALSRDHKATDPDESALVEARGGSVRFGRVDCILAVSRSLGDRDVMRHITHLPELSATALGEAAVLVLACDGLWDVVSNVRVAEICSQCTDAGVMARRLRNEALYRGSADNISIICVDLRADELRSHVSI